MTPAVFSTLDVVEATGLTYRQVDYLCRTGVLDVRSHGPGSQRHFSVSDMAYARVLAVLSSLGANGEVLKPVRMFLEAEGAPETGWLAVDRAGGCRWVEAVDGIGVGVWLLDLAAIFGRQRQLVAAS